MKELIAIVGPTAIGKSRTALHLAQAFNGEIVSADSRQVYRYMDIGTGKPTHEELSLVPHHLIDVVDPDQDFSLAQYQALAYQTIAAIQQRGRLPFLVGGTGLYTRAVLEGWKVPQVPPDPTYRHALETKAAQTGAEGIYRMLVEVDPEAARKIAPHNVRRIIRALEVYQQSGMRFSQLQQKVAPPFRTLLIGLTADRAELYRRIDQRVDEMVQRGLVAEVARLVEMGYALSLPALSGIGYRQIGLFLKAELAMADAVQQIKFETHRFARHQYAWFRLKDPHIYWFDVQSQAQAEISAEVAKLIREGSSDRVS